jgi:hypothetical protein
LYNIIFCAVNGGAVQMQAAAFENAFQIRTFPTNAGYSGKFGLNADVDNWWVLRSLFLRYAL